MSRQTTIVPLLHWSVFLVAFLQGIWQINGDQLLLDDHWIFEPSTLNESVTLPHTVVDLSFRDWNADTWETSWHYRKVFDRPKMSFDARYFLLFDGVLTSTSTTLNGAFLGKHMGGYVPFKYEATHFLTDTNNVLDVVVNGRYKQDVPPQMFPSGRANSTDFYQPAGIYRSVHLLIVPEVFISDVFAKPANVLDPNQRAVNVSLTIELPLKHSGEYTIMLELFDGNFDLVSTATFSASLHKSGIINGSITENLTINLWDLDAPNLYYLNASLWKNENKLHDYSVRFGFREAVFTTTGFYLNGNRIQLIGLNRHQWFPYIGGAMGIRGQRQDASILKKVVNIVRQSHYPQSTAFLDACDELGLLVWIETPGWHFLGSSEQYVHFILRDVQAMIERDRNHPSVVLYAVRLNETPDNATVWSATQRLAKSLDDSRQTTGAMKFFLCHVQLTDFQQDVFSCNDYSTLTVNGIVEPWLLPPRKGRPYLVSESIGSISGFDRFYRRWDPVVVQQNQAIAHAMVQNRAASDLAYCGLIGWCAFDYPSGKDYSDEATKFNGVFDIFRIPKPGAAIYMAQISQDLVIEPSFYWCFDGIFSLSTLGNETLIWSNAEVLKLFIDEQPFAVLYPSTSESYNRLEHPPFIADFTGVSNATFPELRINAYIDGQVVGYRLFSSNTSADQFSMVADDTELQADGSDSTRVVLQVVDQYGNLRPSTVGEVQLELIGNAATLIGDNPFPIGDTGGAGAVWIRSSGLGNKGAVLVVAEHALGFATVEIHFN